MKWNQHQHTEKNPREQRIKSFAAFPAQCSVRTTPNQWKNVSKLKTINFNTFTIIWFVPGFPRRGRFPFFPLPILRFTFTAAWGGDSAIPLSLTECVRIQGGSRIKLQTPAQFPYPRPPAQKLRYLHSVYINFILPFCQPLPWMDGFGNRYGIIGRTHQKRLCM